MTVDELEQLTASASSGESGAKIFHKILRGASGKFGVQILVDVDALNDALEAGTYVFKDKNGHRIMPTNPKLWPKKEFVKNVVRKQNFSECPQPSDDLGDTIDDLSDTIPFD